MKQFVLILGLVGFLLLSVSLASADHSHGSQKAADAYASGDYAMAFHLYSEEAAAGEVVAQEMLGAMYAAGKGVKQDYAEAVKWYRKAAEAGQESAQYTLGGFFYNGQGVTMSKPDAYAWWLVAAAHGNETARKKWRAIKGELGSEETERAHQEAVKILMILAM